MKHFRLKIAALFMSLILSQLAYATPYTMRTIDVPGKFNLIPTGINDAGDVVGIYTDGISGPFQSFLWRDGVVSSVNYPGAVTTQASGINNLGQIVGGADVIGAFLRDPDETFTPVNFPIPSGVTFGFSSPADINNRGDIVGTWGRSVGFDAPRRVFIYRDGIFSEPETGYPSVRSISINDAGWILAWRSVGPFDRQVRMLITEVGVNDVLGLMPNELIIDINDLGQALLRTPDGCAGIATIDASGNINNREPITGVSCTHFLPTRINNVGQIIGTRVLIQDDGTSLQQALLLEPGTNSVSEPESLLLLGIGLSLLRWSRRRSPANF